MNLHAIPALRHLSNPPYLLIPPLKGYVVRMNRFEGVFFLQSLLQCWFWFRLTLLSGAISFFVAALTVSTTTATSSFVPAEYLAIALSASFTIPW